MLALFLPEQRLSLAPAIVIMRLRSSGEFLRSHGPEMTRVLVQSAAELLEHLHGLSIARCGCFCAQLTDPVFESAPRHHVYESGNVYTGWTSCSGQQNDFRKMYGWSR